ncbi:dissimilatory sulfite reductase (desulfoviridin) alpha/beta subunit [Desulfitispora alkaliphila]|uniref:sulfite reductase subunit beta (hemoprotein) n=1 Tax=Desulfitispora alkaliphila TaxID=622674 RepID=UPI003D21A706
MDLTVEQKTALKGQGYIVNKGDKSFSCRVVVPAGKLKCDQAKKIAEVSEKYGAGSFYLTQRLNVEIPGVAYENIETLTKELADVGLTIGSAGKKLKPIHSCKGAVCKLSLYDTDELAIKLNEKFYVDNTKLPAKLRITLAGCFNNCSSPQISCIGVQGKKKDKFTVLIGGSGGRNQSSIGKELSGIFTEDEVIIILEKAINFYKDNALEGERFATVIDRIGFNIVEKALLP